MIVDDLINDVFDKRGGMLDPSPFFALVGDVITHELFVLNLQDFFFDNLEHFRSGREAGMIGLLSLHGCHG